MTPLSKSHEARVIMAANIGARKKSESYCGKATATTFLMMKLVPANSRSAPTHHGKYKERQNRYPRRTVAIP
jgi:hypothetical protein